MGKPKLINLHHKHKLLKCRVDFDELEGHIEMLSILDGYIADRGYKIIRSGCGIHLEMCKNPHFHYHLEVDDSQVKNAEGKYSRNKYLEKKGLKIQPNSISVVTKELTTDISGTSIEEACIRFLGYPLKEIKPIESHCIGIDISACATYANAEWRNVKRQKELDEQKKDEDKLRWSKILNHLDKKELKEYTCIFSELIDYTREENPPVTLKALETKTINYMKQRKLLSSDDLIRSHLYSSKYLYEKEKNSKGTPLDKYDLADCPNETVKLIKQALSQNYNI